MANPIARRMIRLLKCLEIFSSNVPFQRQHRANKYCRPTTPATEDDGGWDGEEEEDDNEDDKDDDEDEDEGRR